MYLIYLSIYLLSIYIYIYIYISIIYLSLSIYLSLFTYLHVSSHPSINLSIHRSVHSPIHLSIHLILPRIFCLELALHLWGVDHRQREGTLPVPQLVGQPDRLGNQTRHQQKVEGALHSPAVRQVLLTHAGDDVCMGDLNTTFGGVCGERRL